MARVLVAEDDELVRRLLVQILAVDNHDVLEAADGSQALAALREHRPAVAILDVVMPGLDGVSVCRAARADPQLRGLHIIILSAMATAQDADAAGADQFVSKPFRPVMLLDLVAQLIGIRQRIR